MKQAFSMLAVMLLALKLLTFPALAADDLSAYTIYYEDGSYAIVSLNSNPFARSGADGETFYTYYNALDQRCFTYAVYGTFTYNGTTSRADSCDYAATIYRQGWGIATHLEYTSGNTVYGNATFTGPDGQTRTASLTLTCDKNGNVT